VTEVSAGGIAAGLAVFEPGLLRWAYLAAIYAGFPIGFAASYVILTAVYFLILTPVGLALRAFGRDPLSRKWDARLRSYWKKRPESRPGSDYYNQS